MTLSELSIRRPVFAWMLMFGLIVFGAICLSRLGVSQSPDIDFPIIEVKVTWEGAAPEVLETEIVDRLEQAFISLEGLKEVRSTIRQGAATITLEFELKRDIDSAVQEVQTKASGVRLPLNVDAPTIAKNNPEDEPVLRLGFSGERSLRDLVSYSDLNLIDQFQVLQGVGEIQLNGFPGRNFRVWMQPDKLAHYELTVLDVAKAIEQQHTEVAAGYLENAKIETNVRTMGEGFTAEQVGAIRILQRGGQNIYNSDIRVRDVARVEDGLNDVRNVARMSGVNGISLGIKKQRGANEVTIGHLVQDKVKEIQKTLPPDLNLVVNLDFTQFTEQAVHHTMQEMILAGLLTAVICFLFLGSWSPALNVILSIPTSVLGTFIVMYFAGFTLNTFTLLGLALAIGIIVDDAIMVLENIVRHFHMGKTRRKASLDGAREVNFAAIAATVAIIAIFLPVAFMSGVIGKFFFQFGITISAAVLLSLLEAITLTPMRCSQFLQRLDKPNAITRTSDRWFTLLAERYARTLDWALRHRTRIFLVSTVCFVFSIWMASRLRQEMVPPQDQNFFRMSLQLKVGSSLEATSVALMKAEEIVSKLPEVERYLTFSGGFDGRVNTGVVAIILKDKGQRKRSQQQIVAQVRKEFSAIPGVVRATPSDNSLRGLQPGRPQAFSFNIRGYDYEVLNEKSLLILEELKKTGLVTDLDTDYRAGMPELRVVPDREAAARAGVTVETIAETINAGIGGLRQGKFTHDGRRYDLRLRVEADSRQEDTDLNKLTVRTNYGELVPLSSVVKYEKALTVQTISRVNRQRSVSIFGNIASGQSQAIAVDKAREICNRILPENYSMYLEGGSQTFTESLSSLWITLVLGIVVAYMVLASQFNSFLHPVTVLLALPFAFTGAFGGLWLTGNSINLYSMIGVILLMGVAKKNSIMLVEFTNKLREEDGLPILDALRRACPIRLRPILMTSAATLSAALPTALANSAGSETRSPMAITIIGGVLVSTLFTLYVVPCAYVAFSRWEKPTPSEEDENEISGVDSQKEYQSLPQA